MPSPSESSPQRAAEVLAANAEFYRIFEARDPQAMAELWDEGADIACTHPGWPMLHGAGPVLESWRQILSSPQHLQFIVTDERVVVEGDVGWVTGVENLLGDDGPQGVASALNLFRYRHGRWRLVAHHAAPVMRRG